jgi:hypothetical protein
MAQWSLPGDVGTWVALLAEVLHQRSAWRLSPLLVGLLFARGRKTIASWLRGNGLGEDYQDYYYFLSSLSGKVQAVADVLLGLVLKVVPLPDRLLFAIDDTPTKRAGPKVQGAGYHHNPTPGTAGGKYLYGHVWVTLAWVVTHPQWGVIGLPLWAFLYVRAKDGVKLAQPDWKHRTKLEMAAEQIGWLAQKLRGLAQPIWVVADGAYAKAEVLGAAVRAGVVFVSRLRSDAALHEPTAPPRTGQRGRPRKYGERISLAKRGGHPRGWQTGTFTLYGATEQRTYKTFEAYYPPAGGRIRVVLVKNPKSWVAFFCTKLDASVADILEAVASRWAIEQVFHDIKEVHGVSEPQVRTLESNVAVFQVILWWHTLIELWAWHQPKEAICDRSDSPWDDTDRRPSHADRRKAMQRACVETELSRSQPEGRNARKILALVRRLMNLAA